MFYLISKFILRLALGNGELVPNLLKLSFSLIFRSLLPGVPFLYPYRRYKKKAPGSNRLRLGDGKWILNRFFLDYKSFFKFLSQKCNSKILKQLQIASNSFLLTISSYGYLTFKLNFALHLHTKLNFALVTLTWKQFLEKHFLLDLHPKNCRFYILLIVNGTCKTEA